MNLPPTHVPAGAVPELEALYDGGRYLAAHARAADGGCPFTLRRAAWTAARHRDLAGAREQMRAVVADHSAYGWGLRMLADRAEMAHLDPRTAAPPTLRTFHPRVVTPLPFIQTSPVPAPTPRSAGPFQFEPLYPEPPPPSPPR